MRIDGMKKLILSSGWIFLLICSYSAHVSSQDVFKCKSKDGKVVFTDNIRKCQANNKQGEGAIAPIDIRLHNLHSQYGQTVSEEFYNYVYRHYSKYNKYNIYILYETIIGEKTPKLLSRVTRKLNQSVGVALSAFPSEVQRQFSDIRYFIFVGDESRTGARKGGLWYFRKNNGISNTFDNSIIVRSAKDYLGYTKEISDQVIVHELSHAYFHYHWGRIFSLVNDAYENAESKKLYRNIDSQYGEKIEAAYATTNLNEYFAELSKIYFYGNYHYPFNAEDLKFYDPQGYAMIKSAYLLN